MLLIEHKIWHGISPEGYRQVITKINQNYICQQGNILLYNLRVLDLVRMSRSHVKGHRREGVCVLRMLLVAVVIVLHMLHISGLVLYFAVFLTQKTTWQVPRQKQLLPCPVLLVPLASTTYSNSECQITHYLWIQFN